MSDETPPPIRTFTYLSAEVQKAYTEKDGAALRNFSKKAADDHEAILRTMFDTKLSPWNQTTVDGKVIHYHGDEKSYVWSKVVSGEGPEPTATIEAAAKADPNYKVVAKATVEVGFYSAGGGQASSFWFEVPRVATDLALGLAVGNLVYRCLSSIISGLTPAATQFADSMEALALAKRNVENAAEGAARNAAMAEMRQAEMKVLGNAIAAGLEAEEMGVIRSLVTRWPRFSASVGTTVIVLIVTYLFDKYVVPHIIQDFWIKINIVNLDKRTWKVDGWYHDNGIIAGGGDFQAVTLPPPSGSKPPFSDKLADFKEASNVTYTFQNSFTLMDGVGAALRVVDASQEKNPTTGFVIGYECPYAKDNWMTIKSGLPTSLKDFYDDKANWPARPQPKNVTDELDYNGEKIKLSALTDDLNGRDDHIYSCFVTIG